MLQPKPLTRADCPRLVSLEGATLSGVVYHHLPQSDDDLSYAGGERGVDSHLAAVDLDFGEHVAVAVTWASIVDSVEGLAVLPAPYLGVGSEVLDASDRDAWRNHIGRKVQLVAAAWQTSCEDGPETIWSVRFTFDTGSVVIALGDLEGGDASRLVHTANSVVVVFDESLARAFPPYPQYGVSGSSWGSPIPR